MNSICLLTYGKGKEKRINPSSGIDEGIPIIEITKRYARIRSKVVL